MKAWCGISTKVTVSSFDRPDQFFCIHGHSLTLVFRDEDKFEDAHATNDAYSLARATENAGSDSLHLADPQRHPSVIKSPPNFPIILIDCT